MIVGFEVLTAVVMKSIIYWDITPCSPLNSTDVSEKNTASPPAFTLVSRSAYTSTLKMEAEFSSETSVEF
jgi:hypothetical protein